MKEDADMEWLVKKIKCYVSQNNPEMALRFMEAYQPIIKDYDEDMAVEALIPEEIKPKTKRSKKRTFKTNKMTRKGDE